MKIRQRNQIGVIVVAMIVLAAFVGVSNRQSLIDAPVTMTPQMYDKCVEGV